MNTRKYNSHHKSSADYDDQYDSFEDEDFLSESEEKIRKDKKKKKKNKLKSLNGTASGSGVKQLLAGYNAKQTKNNWNNTALKTLVDLLGIGLGTTVSATTGKAAPLIAAALIGTGHYVGDESGLLRIIGASTLAHSVAKAKEYREHADQSVADRLKGLKDEWLYAAMLKQINEQQQAKESPPAVATENPKPVITEADLDGLDLYSCPPEFLEEQNQLLHEYDRLSNDELSQSEDEEDEEDDEMEETYEDDNAFDSHPNIRNRRVSSVSPGGYGFRNEPNRSPDQHNIYSSDEIHRMLNGDLPDISQL